MCLFLIQDQLRFIGFQIGFLVEMSTHPVFVDFLAPLADHFGSDTVTDDVGKGSGFRHETVDAENERQTCYRNIANGRERRSQ